MRWWDSDMRLAIGYGTGYTLNLFLLFQQHGEQHDLERSITGLVGTGHRMTPGRCKQFIQRLLILDAKSAPIASPACDFLLDQLRKGRERPSHRQCDSSAVRAISQDWPDSWPSSSSRTSPCPSCTQMTRSACPRS